MFRIKSYKIHLILVVATLAAACGVMPPQKASKEKSSPEKNYPEEGRATYYYTEGIKNNITHGKPELSIELFKKVVALDSTHAPSFFELASLTAPSDPKTALQYSIKACESDTANTWYRTQLGRLLIANQRYDSALTVYTQLLRQAPNNPENYRQLAMLYEQQSMPEKALALLDSAQNRIGINAALMDSKRQLLLNLKRYEQALNEAKAMVENFPDDNESLIGLAELYAIFGKDDLAQMYYDKALAIDPTDMGTIASLNNFYKQTNNIPRFLETTEELFRSKLFPLKAKLNYLEELINQPNFYRDNYPAIGKIVRSLATTYPQDRKVMELYAQHLIAGGSLEEALKFYKLHTQDSIADKALFNRIIEMEAYLKRPDSVAHYSTLALQRFPKDAELYLRKGSIAAFFQNDLRLAETNYKLALEFAHNDSLRSIIYGALGDNYQSLNEYKKAFRCYEKGMKLDSTNAVIPNNYAYFLSLRKEQLERALEMVKKANRLDPNNPTYLDTYGWVLYELGRMEEARTIMRQAISLDRTNNKDLFFHYGEILYQLKDHFMASFYWKKAQENGYDPVIIEQRLKLIEQP